MDLARLRLPTMLAGAAAVLAAATLPGGVLTGDTTRAPAPSAAPSPDSPPVHVVPAAAGADGAAIIPAGGVPPEADAAPAVDAVAEKREIRARHRAAQQRTVSAAGATAPSAAAPADRTALWHRLAACESGGRWDYDGPSGYDGGLQFHPSTWRAHAPAGYPAYAHQATAAQQIAVAERVLDDQGWRAWPRCARHLGLR